MILPSTLASYYMQTVLLVLAFSEGLTIIILSLAVAHFTFRTSTVFIFTEHRGTRRISPSCSLTSYRLSTGGTGPICVDTNSGVKKCGWKMCVMLKRVNRHKPLQNAVR